MWYSVERNLPPHPAAAVPAQSESIDGAEVAGVPDVEGSVEHVCLLQLVKLGLAVAQLAVQAPAGGAGGHEKDQEHRKQEQEQHNQR